MKLTDLFKGAFRAAKEEGVTIDGVDDTTTPDQALAAVVPPDPRVAELQQQLAAMQTQARRTAAEVWADTQIQARRATVGERAHLVALHLRAAEDDAAHPGEQSRLAALESTLAARPPHQWSTETVPVTALPLTQGADAAARRRELLALTPLGRTVLAKETK